MIPDQTGQRRREAAALTPEQRSEVETVTG